MRHTIIGAITDELIRQATDRPFDDLLGLELPDASGRASINGAVDLEALADAISRVIELDPMRLMIQSDQPLSEEAAKALRDALHRAAKLRIPVLLDPGIRIVGQMREPETKIEALTDGLALFESGGR